MKLVRFYCPTHGLLCTAPDHALVLCGQTVKSGVKTRCCNRRATTVKPERKVAA